MLRFITMCSEQSSTKKYIHIIDKLMMNSDLFYEIYVYDDNKGFNQFGNINCGTTIFLIENNNSISAEGLIKVIRDNYRMITAFIIIIDSSEDEELNEFIKNDSFLTEIIKDGEDVLEKLQKDLNNILEITNNKQVLNIICDKLLYRIPFSDIYYIEKELNGKRSKIVSKSGDYKIVKSLNDIQNSLNDRFYRSHQSAIINIDNVRKIDFENNKVIFDEGVSCDLLSRSFKRSLRANFTKCK